MPHGVIQVRQSRAVLVVSAALLLLATSTALDEQTPLNGGQEGLDFLGNVISDALASDGGVSDDELETISAVVVCYLDDGITTVGECISQKQGQMPLSLSTILGEQNPTNPDPDKPSDLTSEAGSNFEWDYVEETTECQNKENFHPGLRDSNRLYYCGSGNQHLWRAQSTCEEGFSEESDVWVCGDGIPFSLEEDGILEYRIVPDSGYSVSSPGDGTITSRNGGSYDIIVSGSGSGDETYSINLPEARISFENNIVVFEYVDQVSDSFEARVENYDGGSGEGFNGIANKFFQVTGGEEDIVSQNPTLDSSSAGNEKVTVSPSTRGEYSVSSIITYDTPGDDMRVSVSDSILVGDGFTRDLEYLASEGEPYQTLNTIESEWDVFTKQESGGSFTEKSDLTTEGDWKPMESDISSEQGFGNVEEGLRIQAKSDSVYQVKISREIFDPTEQLTFKAKNNGAPAEVYIENSEQVLMRQDMAKTEDYRYYRFKYKANEENNPDDNSLLYDSADTYSGLNVEEGQGVTTDDFARPFSKIGFTVSADTNDLDWHSLNIRYIVSQQG